MRYHLNNSYHQRRKGNNGHLWRDEFLPVCGEADCRIERQIEKDGAADEPILAARAEAPRELKAGSMEP